MEEGAKLVAYRDDGTKIKSMRGEVSIDRDVEVPQGAGMAKREGK